MANSCVVAEGVHVDFLTMTAREQDGRRHCLLLANYNLACILAVGTIGNI